VEFPRAVSALHSRCSDLEERRKLAESVYEEETGKLSGSKAHPELFLDFAAGVGLRREEVLAAEPLPSTAALIHWFEYSTKILPFLEGVAAINLAAERQVVGAFGPFARALQKHYGLSETEVAFWDIHELADAEHSDVGDHIVVKHATTEELQRRVRQAVRTSLGMWWQFFEGMAERHGAPNSFLSGSTDRSTITSRKPLHDSTVRGQGLEKGPLHQARRWNLLR